MGFGRGNVLQLVGCITILLRSMVAICESNENGRFLTQLGLAKLTGGRLEDKSKMLFFSERQNYFEEKTQAFCILA